MGSVLEVGWGVQSFGRVLKVESLLLHMERLWWFLHLIGMVSGSLLDVVFQECPTRSKPPPPKQKPRTHWRDYATWLTWEHIGVPADEGRSGLFCCTARMNSSGWMCCLSELAEAARISASSFIDVWNVWEMQACADCLHFTCFI